jgi:hypothetical protein
VLLISFSDKNKKLFIVNQAKSLHEYGKIGGIVMEVYKAIYGKL